VGREVGTKHPEYPARLKDLAKAPDPVFLAGPWDHPGPFVAIVGTRGASDDGRDVASELAGALAERGVAILSGLARGIDAAAHEGALAAGGVSGAVLGTPLDVTYPREHASLQSRLRESLGLMSEIPRGSPTTPSMFAARNRMLAALADVVVIVQGRMGSGALLTAKEAHRLGRPLAALPWDSRDPLAEAPHGLIRDGKATLVATAEDVMALIARPVASPFQPRRGERRKQSPAVAPETLPPHERALYQALRERSLPLDRIATIAGLTASELCVALVSLELSGLARREPGGRARRARRP